MIRNVSELLKGSPRTTQARRLVLNLLNAALKAVDPQILVPRVLKLNNNNLFCDHARWLLDDLNGIYVIGAGKASGRIAEAIETLLRQHITDGFIIVPEYAVDDYFLEIIRIHPGGHPVPTKASISSTQYVLDFLAQIPADALVLSAFSGGGSALFTLPAPSITLEDLQDTNRLLMQSGATIIETNTIRKHLSQVKGGQLSRLIHPRPHLGLLLSDVPGDQLDMIASGPTLPDTTTFDQAAAILDAYELWERMPTSVHKHIKRGVDGKVPETPKPHNPIFHSSYHQVIGANRNACLAALAYAHHHQYPAHILTTDCQGEAREVGAKLGEYALRLTSHHDRQIVIVGSETTVTLHSDGKGGRNTEIVTAALPYLQGTEGLVLASLATDGIDGPTDAAGAIADGDSIRRIEALTLSPQQALDTHTTYHLFHTLEDLLFTGPTHTNVRDLTIIGWVGRAE